MKKLLFLGLAATMMLGLAVSSYAADAQVFIHVTVVSGVLGVERVSDEVIDLDQVTVGTSAYTSEAQFRNSSDDTREDFSLSAENNVPTPWTWDTNAPGTAFGSANIARLTGLWRATGDTPDPTDFLADDVLTTTVTESTTDIYAVSGDSDAVKGFNIDANDSRYIFFRFDAPIAGSDNIGVRTDITVTVTASSAI